MIESRYDKYWNAKGSYGRERVRRKKLRKEARFTKRHTCPKCHKFKPGDVELRIDPYTEEIYGFQSFEKMCTDCYLASQADI